MRVDAFEADGWLAAVVAVGPVGDAGQFPTDPVEEKKATSAPAPAAAPVPAAPKNEEEEEARSSPLVRKIAREHGVNLSQLSGTGLPTPPVLIAVNPPALNFGATPVQFFIGLRITIANAGPCQPLNFTMTSAAHHSS